MQNKYKDWLRDAKEGKNARESTNGRTDASIPFFLSIGRGGTFTGGGGMLLPHIRQNV